MFIDVSQYVWFLLLSVAMYLMGLVVAWVGGWAQVYLGSLAFALGATGIGWVWAAVASRVKDAYTLYVNLGDLYETPIEDYDRFVSTEHRQILNGKFHAFGVLILTASFGLMAYLAFYAWPVSIFGKTVYSARPWLFQQAFYSPPHLASKFSVLVLFAIAIAGCLVVALWLMLRETVTLRRMSRFSPLPLPELVRHRLRPLADFHIRFASEWSAGVVLFLLLFFRTPDVFSIAAMSVLAAIGLAAFIIPQRFLSRIIGRSYDLSCAMVLRSYEDSKPVLAKLNAPTRAGAYVESIASIRAALAPVKYSVYGLDEFARWTVSQCVAFICVAIQVGLTVAK